MYTAQTTTTVSHNNDKQGMLTYPLGSKTHTIEQEEQKLWPPLAPLL